MYIEVARSFSLIGNGVHVPEKNKSSRLFFFSLSDEFVVRFVSRPRRWWYVDFSFQFSPSLYSYLLSLLPALCCLASYLDGAGEVCSHFRLEMHLNLSAPERVASRTIV